MLLVERRHAGARLVAPDGDPPHLQRAARRGDHIRALLVHDILQQRAVARQQAAERGAVENATSTRRSWILGMRGVVPRRKRP